MIKTKQMSLCIFLKQHLAGSLPKKQMKSTLKETLISFLSVFLIQKAYHVFFVSLKIDF